MVVLEGNTKKLLAMNELNGYAYSKNENKSNGTL